MGELLAEIVEEHLRTVADHCQRRVVTHRCHRFLACSGHRDDGLVDVLLTIAELHQPAPKIADAVVYLSAALEFLQLYAVLVQPLPVRMGFGQLLLDLAIVVDPAFLGIDEQDLSWLQTPFGDDITRLEIHHAHL